MTKRKVVSAKAHRQAVLHHLNQTGPMTARQLAEATGYEKRTLQSYLREMCVDNELARSEHFEGNLLVVTYTALVEHTNHVDPVRANAKQQPVKRDRPGVHRGTERAHPIPNQGGQGALREFPGIKPASERI